MMNVRLLDAILFQNQLKLIMEIDPIANLPIKIITVGDHLVGKSCAITSFITSSAPIQRHSTVFDSSACDIRVDGSNYHLSIMDTTGNQVYYDLIKSTYKDADIFLIFFSVIDPDTFKNAVQKWYPQVRQANAKALVFFVGNKIDERAKSSRGNIVTTAQATSKIQQNLNHKYLECSAITRTGLSNIFEYSVRQYVLSKNQNIPTNGKRTKVEGCCMIM